MTEKKTASVDYKQAGVDIAAGEQAVKNIKDRVRTTYNKNVLSELGSFGGLYRMDKEAWDKPILVSSTDGVGTKLMVAIMAGKFDSVGQDLVNHCVNDILVQGAIPQFFLDYIGVGKLSVDIITSIIDGFVKACKENNCVLIGGEMAEMPGLYKEGDFDLAGTIIGLVEEDYLLPRASMQEGDVLYALPSSGLHTNGFSLARKVLFDIMKLDVDSMLPGGDKTVGETLLAVHKSYLHELMPYLKDPGLRALAHITGGGIAGNLSRVIPDHLQAQITLDHNQIPQIYKVIQKGGNVSDEVMKQTFNLGVGMILVLSKDLADKLQHDVSARYLGEIILSCEKDRVVFK
ncbi:MAG: phosphoribosylformylglycinamidine cyclo-ligase [Candidatus Cloacimonetes bacterium]|jgi:phosphoribosylformylglycinamidine cyclo-ligase|nr:phosphoribosylformylglycinamidine cyclo-ligase [Candidatus Cloacimonadota bacterium]